MDNKEKVMLAKRQIATKWKCDPGAFDAKDNVFFASKDTFFEIITFGVNAVIRADETILDWCNEKFLSLPARDIMDEDNLYDLDTFLRSLGKKLSGEHIGYLHLFPEKVVAKPQGFTYRLFVGEEIAQLRAAVDYNSFDNAFSHEPERDVLAIAAYDGDNIAAIAGSDDYLDTLWQIGIDTQPAYRHRGLGAYLVKQITCEIERLHKVAYYNTWSANLPSTKIALSTGFYPTWMGYPSQNV